MTPTTFREWWDKEGRQRYDDSAEEISVVWCASLEAAGPWLQHHSGCRYEDDHQPSCTCGLDALREGGT